jgi:DNA-directed RNA polymerase subunit RPC12/RpoP
MPQKVTCAECNHLLYEGDILKSPQDIIKKLDGRCPKCNRKLVFATGGVSISPFTDSAAK